MTQKISLKDIDEEAKKTENGKKGKIKINMLDQIAEFVPE